MSYWAQPKDMAELQSRLKELERQWDVMRFDNESIYGRNNPVSMAITRCIKDLFNATNGCIDDNASIFDDDEKPKP